MKRISSLFLFSLSLFMGCRTADSTAFVNPLKLLSTTPKEATNEEEIRENSLQFVENVKKQAAGKSEEATQSVQLGQQQIVSWYQDQDDRHIGAAKKHFRNSLQVQPTKNADAHHGLAVVADLEEKFPEAERQYQLALAQSPSDSKLLGNLGYSYLLQNRLNESERYLSQAVQKDPTNTDAIKHLGDVYAQQGRLGEAQETYSRVMRPQAARQLIADRTPPTSNTNESLLGRLIPGRNQEESTALTNEINELRQLQAEQDRALERNTHQSAGSYNRGSIQPQYGPSPEQVLKQNLATINQEQYRNMNGRPVMIDSATGEMQRIAPGQRQPQSNPQYYARQNQPATMYGGMAPSQSQNPSFIQHPQRSHMAENGLPQIQSNVENQGTFNSQNRGSHLAQQRQQFNMFPPRNSPVDPLRQPWTGLQTGNEGQQLNQVRHQEPATVPQHHGVQNLQYNESSSTPYGHPAQQQQSYPANSNHDGRQQERSERIAPQQQQQRHRQSNQDQNAFENATMEAARLGMGLGPGTMFSTINQTAPRQQPGANSTWNGNSFSQPNRMLPTNLPPQDLQQAYSQPVVNSLGQQVPGSQVTNQTSQFGTASRFDAQYQQSGNLPPNNPQQQYQMQQKSQQLETEQRLTDQRIQANQQLNATMQDAWNQRRMNLHTPAPHAPALLSPAEHGGMVPVPASPNGEILRDGSYPNNQPQPANQSQYPEQNRQGQNRQGQNLQRQNQQPQNGYQESYYNTPGNQNVVVPAPYNTTQRQPVQQRPYQSGGVIQSSYSQQPNSRTPPPSYNSFNRGGFQPQSNNSLPTIIPGSR